MIRELDEKFVGIKPFGKNMIVFVHNVYQVFSWKSAGI